MAVVSDGAGIYSEASEEYADIVGKRKREALEAAKILGVKQVYFLDLPDGKVSLFSDELARKIGNFIAVLAPDVIFAPSPLEFHEDHRAVSTVAMSLLNGTKKVKLAFYEVYGTIRFNCVVDITAVLSVKENAVMSYPCSLYNSPRAYAEAIMGLNRFRSFYTGGKGYYEAYWIVENPMSRLEMTEWLTYGGKEECPSVTKEVGRDALNTIDDERKAVAVLSSSLVAKTDELAAVTLRLEEANRVIENITGSIFWRIAKGFYRFRDWSLPTTSPQRRIYDSIMSLFRRK